MPSIPEILISAHPFAAENSAPLDTLDAAGFKILRHGLGRKPLAQELVPLLSTATGLIAGTEALPAQLLAQAPQLRVISRIGVGLDSIDLAACKRRGIRVLTTPDAASQAVAEYALGLIIALCRGLVASHEAMRAGRWERRFGRELAGTRLGLLGFGRIARALTPLAKACGMQIAAHDPHHHAAELQAAGVRPCDFAELLASSDVLSLHLPLNESTKGLIDERVMSAMAPGTYLINTSRGALIDEAALCKALQSGHLAGAALDVFSQEPYSGPLLSCPNLILSPHMAANSRAARQRMEAQAARNLAEFFRSDAQSSDPASRGARE